MSTFDAFQKAYKGLENMPNLFEYEHIDFSHPLVVIKSFLFLYSQILQAKIQKNMIASAERTPDTAQIIMERKYTYNVPPSTSSATYYFRICVVV